MPLSYERRRLNINQLHTCKFLLDCPRMAGFLPIPVKPSHCDSCGVGKNIVKYKMDTEYDQLELGICHISSAASLIEVIESIRSIIWHIKI